MREKVPHLVRLGKAEDLPYAVETWLRSDSSWKGKSKAREVQAGRRSLLARPGVVLRVAHDPGDEDAILAWALLELSGEKVVLHWAYTREPLRRMGLQRSLIEELVERFREPRP